MYGGRQKKEFYVLTFDEIAVCVFQIIGTKVIRSDTLNRYMNPKSRDLNISTTAALDSSLMNNGTIFVEPIIFEITSKISENRYENAITISRTYHLS